MKATTMLVAALALAGSAMATPVPQNKGVQDLDKLPKCWQDCFREQNKVVKPWDLNTISDKDFCEDKTTAIQYWRIYQLNPCTVKCPENTYDKARAWYRAKCDPFNG